jgi:hypothetical protein
MTNSTQEYKVKREAFIAEFEKLGGYALLGRLLTKAMTKVPVIKDAVKGLSNFATKHSTRPISKPLYSTSGKTFTEGMSALKSTTGKSTVRPWFGKSQVPLGVRKVSRTPFFKDPLRATGEAVQRGAAHTIDNLKTVAKEGVGSFFKKEFARSQTFAKTVTGKNGKQFEVIGKRSIPGRLLNPMWDTGAGFGALSLATDSHDQYGKKRSFGSRLGRAAGETALFGVGRPVGMAYVTAVELPKMMKSTFKGF